MSEQDVYAAAGPLASQNGSSIVTTTADEPLVIDFTPQVNPGQVVIVTGISVVATLTQRQIDTRGVPPGSGLFLCGPGTPPVEAGTALVAPGVSVEARGMPIPLNDPYLNVQIASPAPSYAVQMVMAPGKITVPERWFIRAIIMCAQGTATPGPGANSRGIMQVFGALQRACPCPA